MTVVYGPVTFEAQLVQNFVINACIPVKVALLNPKVNTCIVTFQKQDGQMIGPFPVAPSQSMVRQLNNLLSFSVDTTPFGAELIMEIVTADEDIDPKYLGAVQTATGDAGATSIASVDPTNIRHLTPLDELTINGGTVDIGIINSVVDVDIQGTVDVAVQGPVDVEVVGPADIDIIGPVDINGNVLQNQATVSSNGRALALNTVIRQ
ncbi:MAG: hypothetical protein WA549_00160 [Thermoplasmata archaeon]